MSRRSSQGRDRPHAGGRPGAGRRARRGSTRKLTIAMPALAALVVLWGLLQPLILR